MRDALIQMVEAVMGQVEKIGLLAVGEAGREGPDVDLERQAAAVAALRVALIAAQEAYSAMLTIDARSFVHELHARGIGVVCHAEQSSLADDITIVYSPRDDVDQADRDRGWRCRRELLALLGDSEAPGKIAQPRQRRAARPAARIAASAI